MPFSRKQIIQIEVAAKAAFEIHEEHDLLELPGDLDGESKTARYKFWRKRELCQITGQFSYNSCDARKDYLKVKGHFQKLSGNKAGAEKTRQRDEWGSDLTHTDGCEAFRQIKEAMREADLSQSYVMAIMKGKFRGETDIRQLSEKQLEDLRSTIRNRANAKLDKKNPNRKGAGDKYNRNKSQRAKRQAEKAQMKLPIEPGDELSPF